MCAAQPATAAPPAIANTSGFSRATEDVAILTQIAADDVGIVRRIPITIAMKMPTIILTASPASIARIRAFAIKSMSLMNGHARYIPPTHKISMPSGTNTISNLVFPAYSPAISMVNNATT